MNKRRFIDERIRKDVESLDKGQLREIFLELYRRADDRLVLMADRLISERVRANAASALDTAQKADLKKAVEARLENWLNLDEEELFLIADSNEDWNEWDASYLPEYVVEDPNQLGRIVQRLLLDTETAAQSHWWELTIRLVQAVFADPIVVEGDAGCEQGGLELLAEEIWREDLPQKTIRSVLKQAVLDRQLPADQKVQMILELMKIASVNPDILPDLAAVNASLVSSPEFLHPWLAGIMKADCFSERSKAEVFAQAVGLQGDEENSEELLWQYGPAVPQIYFDYYSAQNEHWSPEKRTAYLKRVYEQPELSAEQSVQLLDQLMAAYSEAGQTDQAAEAGLQAFRREPSFKRYASLALLCPEKKYLSVFDSDWKSRLKYQSDLIEAFEGNPEPYICSLQEADGHDVCQVITVLLGILCEGKMDNKALQSLVSCYLTERGRIAYFSSCDSKTTMADFGRLFKRAAQRTGWDQKQADRLLKLIYDAVKSFTDRVLSLQNRQEYYRCAQLIGALAYAAELRGHPDAVQKLTEAFKVQTRRYRNFKTAFRNWVAAGD